MRKTTVLLVQIEHDDDNDVELETSFDPRTEGALFDELNLHLSALGDEPLTLRCILLGSVKPDNVGVLDSLVSILKSGEQTNEVKPS